MLKRWLWAIVISSVFGLGKQSMFSITAKSNGICFVSPIKQPELTNFLFTFWLKNTFHVPLSWLLMVPIVVNSDSKKKKKWRTFYVPRLCYSQPLWGSTDRAMRGVMHCHSLNKISSIRQQDFTLWCLPPPEWKQRKESPNKQFCWITV